MTFALIWLADVLEAAGLKVALVDGWKTRGRSDMGEIRGVMCHLTVGRPDGNMPSLDTLINGRPRLRGPLANLGLGRDGTYYVIAAGRANHAGVGSWRGVTTGNSSFIGIEAEHTGRPEEPWPEVQLDAYLRGAAALIKHTGVSTQFVVGHREYALPAGRKSDPNFDMDEFRARVGEILSGAAAVRPLIPKQESNGRQRSTLRRGMQGPLVMEVQRKLNLTADGLFGPRTEAAVRAFQRDRQLVPDGIVGPKTWARLDEL